MKISINKYPFNKDCALLIGLDDLHPEGKSSREGLDFGLDIKGPFWRNINYLIEKEINIKFTLFTVANWIDLSDFPSRIFFPLRKMYRIRREYPKNTFNLDNDKFHKWIKKLNFYIRKGIFEISMHGLSHHNPKLIYSQSQEFVGMRYHQSVNQINSMIEVFNRSGLSYIRGFRPPGWGINGSLYRCLKKYNFLYIADRYDFYSPINKLKVLKFKDGILSIQANCFPSQLERCVDIARSKGIIILHSHLAKTTWGLNIVNKDWAINIEKIISEIKLRTLNNIWFCTFSELACFDVSKNNLTYKVEKHKVIFINNSIYPLVGLTVKINGRNFVIDRIEPKDVYILDPSLNNKESRVSIVITVFNGEKNIEKCLISLSNQSYYNSEILIVNDGSTDKTLKKLLKIKRKLNDKRIKIFNLPHQGRSYSKQYGLKNSTGKYIAFCEDDAIYGKDYIKSAVLALEKSSKNVAGAIGPHFVLNRDESVWTRIKDIERRKNFINYNPSSAWIYKKEILEKVNGFNITLEFGEDIEPSVKLRKLGYEFLFIKDCIWLHLEPNSLFGILKRKFKGGLGMSVLYKLKIIKNPLSKKITFKISILIAIIILIFIENKFIFLDFVVFLIGLLLIRTKEITKYKEIYHDSIFLTIFGIFIEYLWWISTLSGLFIGLMLDNRSINNILKGRSE